MEKKVCFIFLFTFFILFSVSLIFSMKHPNDFWYKHGHTQYQWNLGPSTASAGTINACEAWDYTTGSSDVVVAIIDTGFDI